MIGILSALGLLISTVRNIEDISNYNKSKIDDELVPMDDIDLVAIRDKMCFLQEVLNREFPLPSFNNYELIKFAERGIGETADKIFDKMSEIGSDVKYTILLINEVSDWNSISEVIRNIEKIIEIIYNIVELAFIAKDSLVELVNVSPEELSEAASKYLEKIFKFSPVIEIFDKYLFKVISYVIIVTLRKIFIKKGE